MSRDALTVLREVRANYAGALLDSGVRPKSVEYALQPLDEAIAQVEALVAADRAYNQALAAKFRECTVSALDIFNAARDRRAAALQPFAPGQDSEGSP